jgi:hypothetical protein
MNSLTMMISLSMFSPLTMAQTKVVVIPMGGDTYQAGVAKTGQTTCYESPGVLIPCSDPDGLGQDGNVQAGVTWPSPRFTDNSDGTVRDNLTGLIWLKNANCSGGFPKADGKMARASALGFVKALNLNQLLTNCGDVSNNGSTQNDWRLPNRFELESLLDLSQGEFANPVDIPALPVGHPFSNVEVDDYYWSSSFSSYFKGLGVGWAVSFSGGDVASRSWALHTPEIPSHSYVWPVRGGAQ